MESSHPEWISPTSPTQRVGGALRKDLSKLSTVPMLSLANTYSRRRDRRFYQTSPQAVQEQAAVKFCAELKMDGVAVTVSYEKGIFAQALTRGDGRKGEDITQNMKTIRSVPLELKGRISQMRWKCAERCLCRIKLFKELNEEKEEEGKSLWANPAMLLPAL